MLIEFWYIVFEYSIEYLIFEGIFFVAPLAWLQLIIVTGKKQYPSL
jgi:hypothetical protein